MLKITNKMDKSLDGNKLFKNLYNQKNEASCGKYCKYYISKALPIKLSFAQAMILKYEIIHKLYKSEFKVKKSDKSAFTKINKAIIEHAHDICPNNYKEFNSKSVEIISITNLYE